MGSFFARIQFFVRWFRILSKCQKTTFPETINLELNNFSILDC